MSQVLDHAGVCTQDGPCVTTPIGPGPNWVTRVKGLPLYIRAIAQAQLRAGKTESEAIRLAVGVVRRWARGEGHVTPATRARAAKALAEWEAKKAASHVGVKLAVEAPPKAQKVVSAKLVHRLLAESYPERVLGWADRAGWTYKPDVPLSSIDMSRRPGGRDPQKVVAIGKAITEGQKMAPVVLVRTSDGLEIADGYHRTLAFQHAKRSTIPAFIGVGAGDHGPWESAMHAAKLNLTQEAPVTAVDLAAGSSMAERMMPDRAALIRVAKKVEAWPDGPRKTAMKAKIAARARALKVKPDGDGDFDMDKPAKGVKAGVAMANTVTELVRVPKMRRQASSTPNTAERRKLASEGKALPGGSQGGRFPIRDRSDLHKAIRAVGRAKGDHAKVRRFIHKRAVALGATDMLPKGWKPDGKRTLASRITRRGAK